MKLLSIRLHPFAGTPDRTFNFAEGAECILGDNETGKSTMLAALRCALHVSTNLTPARLRDEMGAYFPKPGGDRCSVTLQFSVEGSEYTLEKTWSGNAGARHCALRSGDRVWGEPNEVQNQIATLRVLDSQVYDSVLVLSQDTITKTIEVLSKNRQVVDGSLAQVIARGAGEWDLQSLLREVDNQIAKDLGRWDSLNGRPETDKGIARDIDNPWMNQLGAVIKAYYESRRATRAADTRRTDEETLERNADRLADLDTQIRGLKEDAQTAETHFRARQARDRVEAQLCNCQAEATRLASAQTDWATQEAAIPMLERRCNEMAAELAKLDREEGHRQSRERLSHVTERLEQLRGLHRERAKADEDLKQFQHLPSDIGAQLEECESRLRELQIKLEAQRLRVQLHASREVTVRLTCGSNPATQESLAAGQRVEKDADGRVQLEIDGTQVVVESGQADIAMLLRELESAKRELQAMLAQIDADDAPTARKQIEKRAQAEMQRQNLGMQLHALEKEGSLDTLEQEVARLAEIPLTRGRSEIQTERDALMTRQGGAQLDLQTARERIEEHMRVHKVMDKSALLLRMVETKGKEVELNKELADLPPLPDAVGSLAELEANLGTLRRTLESAERDSREIQIQRATIAARLNAAGDIDLDALELKAKSTARDFENALARVEALGRLKSALAGFVGAEDRYAGLTGRVSSLVKELTDDRYDTVRADANGLPTQVCGPGRELGVDLLSQGAQGSLALAIRLALAESHLERAPGFLVLDDPFVDLDPRRLALALGCIRKFADRRGVQVILLTCHPVQHEVFHAPMN